MSSSPERCSLAGFAISVERGERATVVRLHGEIDRGVVHLLRWSVGRVPAGHPVELDLGEVGFVDVSGYRALRALVDDLRRRDDRLVVGEPPRCVRWIEELLDVDDGIDRQLVGAGCPSVLSERF